MGSVITKGGKRKEEKNRRYIYYTVVKYKETFYDRHTTLTPGVARTPSSITKTRLFKYIENFTTQNWKFSDKKSDILHISAQNTDCGYPLEPPRPGGSNEYPQSMFLSRNKKIIMYTPVNPCWNHWIDAIITYAPFGEVTNFASEQSIFNTVLIFKIKYGVSESYQSSWTKIWHYTFFMDYTFLPD